MGTNVTSRFLACSKGSVIICTAQRLEATALRFNTAPGNHSGKLKTEMLISLVVPEQRVTTCQKGKRR